MWQGLGAWPVQCLTGTCRPSRCTNVCVFWACISTCTGVRPPQARLINHAVSVRSALSGAQPASQLSGKVTVAKPNWAKLTIAGSSENMETCLTPTRYCRNPLRTHVHCGSMQALKEATVLSQHVSVYLFLASPPTSSEHLPTEGHIWSGDTSVCTCTSVPSVRHGRRRIRPAHQSLLHYPLTSAVPWRPGLSNLGGSWKTM